MDDLEVRIVKLEPMRVASFHGYSETPEKDAHEKSIPWMEKSGLLKKPDSYRHFGFNNPNPSPGSPKYGYEIWISIPSDLATEDDIEVKDFPGGLYAVLRCDTLSTIGQDWKKLIAWRETSKYKHGYHQWLEELLTKPASGNEEDYRFDLYSPIVE